MKSLFLAAASMSFLLFSAKAQFPNIVIGTSNSPNEPSIMINPKNPQQMVVGANINTYFITAGMQEPPGLKGSFLRLMGCGVIR